MLLYSPVALKDELLPVYYKQWLLLVNALTLLLKKSISHDDVETAYLLLSRFVLETEYQYVLEHTSYKIPSGEFFVVSWDYFLLSRFNIGRITPSCLQTHLIVAL